MHQKPVKVKMLDSKGNIKRIFNSIHQFRTFTDSNRLCSTDLKKLKEKHVVKVNGYYICLFSTNHVSAFKKRKEYEDIFKRSVLSSRKEFRSENILKSKQNAEEIIVVLDQYLRILDVCYATIGYVSQKYKIPEGTIKASLSKGKRNIKKWVKEDIYVKHPNSKSTGLYFVYVKDLIK